MSLGATSNEAQAEGDLFGVAEDQRVQLRGRPKGSINRRTKETVEFLLERFGDPLINLAEMNALDIPNLARALNCTRLEAAKLLLEVNTRLANYVHSKRPTAIIARVEDVAPLTINVPSFGDFDDADEVFEINVAKSIAYADESATVAQVSVAQDD